MFGVGWEFECCGNRDKKGGGNKRGGNRAKDQPENSAQLNQSSGTFASILSWLKADTSSEKSLLKEARKEVRGGGRHPKEGEGVGDGMGTEEDGLLQYQHEEKPQVRHTQDLPALYNVDWTSKGVLGKGHFATVYRGFDRLKHRKVAVKSIMKKKSKVKALQTEIDVLATVAGHPNIVALYDIFYDDSYLYLMLEFLAGGELFNRIVEGGAYSERDASRHLRKIADALKFMHKKGIVHRDLKPENLVLAEASVHSEIKISDFGLSRILKEDEEFMSTICGTKAYSAPEVAFYNQHGAKKEYTSKVDMWSLGVIMFVILAAYHPYDPYGKDTDDVIWKRIQSESWDFNDNVWTKISSAAKDLITKLMCMDPKRRLSATEVLNHPWITQFQELSTENITTFSSRSLKPFVSNIKPSPGNAQDGASIGNIPNGASCNLPPNESKHHDMDMHVS